jgi:hypothetical protein
MTALTLVSVLAGGVFAFLLAWGMWSGRRQRRVLGPACYRDCLATTKTLARHSGRLRMLSGSMWLFLVTGVALLVLQWVREASLVASLVALALLVTGLGQWARARVPASLLVLGSSAEEQLALQAAIRDAILPFRPVSLLQTGQLRVDVTIPGDCFRIDRGMDWREAVAALSRSVAVIVLDVRSVTPFVREEIAHLSVAGYAHKTLVIGPDGTARLLDEERGARPGTPGRPDVGRVDDTAAAVGLLRHILLENEVVPAPDRPMGVLALQWREWQAAGGSVAAASRTPGVAPGGADQPAVHPRCERLAPFAYRPPPGWQVKVLAEEPEQYAVLFRPPGERGLLGVLRRRARLDLMVFRYPDETIHDEAAFRRATEQNLESRGATITRERVGRRCGVMSHECHFQRGVSVGYLVRFISRGAEFVVYWAAMDGTTSQRYLPAVEAFVDGIEA